MSNGQIAAVNQQLTTTRTIGQGVGFERTARITGYLSSVPRFCNAKQAELKDRVLHVGKPAVMLRIWAKAEEAA